MSVQNAQNFAPWKLDLIRERATRMQLQPADVDDAVQEIAIELLDFEFVFDPENPATEKTALTAVIDNLLKMKRRSEKRYQNRIENFGNLQRSPIRSSRDTQGSRDEPEHSDHCEQTIDVQDAIKSLDQPEREICHLLAEGNTLQQVADQLECSRTTVETHLLKIRERFRQLGVHLWLIADCAEESNEEELLLLPARKAAALCGMSVRTWRTWDAAGLIPRSLQVGRSLFWRADELREWVAAGCPRRETWMTIRDQT
jgi:RNA polymerase sigma factor (sigma-70 family)